MTTRKLTARLHAEALEPRELPSAVPLWNLALGYNDNGQGRVRYMKSAQEAYTFNTHYTLYHDPPGALPAQELRVAVGDVNGDGIPDLAVGAGLGGGPRVSVFDGTSLRRGQTQRNLCGDYFALDPAVQSGINVAVMDVNRDGRGDVLAGFASGFAEMVAVDGAGLLAPSGVTVTKLWDRPFGDPTSAGGVRMAVKDLDGDGRPDLAFANGDRARVTVYRAAFLTPAGTATFVGRFDAPAAAGVWVG